MKTIDLADHRSEGVHYLIGRSRGELVRAATRLDEADARGERVRVIIPEDIFGIASSFWLGMFGPSVRHLGADGFRGRYEFFGPNVNLIVEDGVREALKYHSPLV